MKKIMASIMILASMCIISCTKQGGVSDEVKSVVVNKAVNGKAYKLPKTGTTASVKEYHALKPVIDFKVESTKTEGDTTTISGTITVSDVNKLQAIIMTSALSGPTNVERTIASVEEKIKSNPNYKPKPHSQKYTVVYTTKDGKDTVTSIKKVK